MKAFVLSSVILFISALFFGCQNMPTQKQLNTAEGSFEYGKQLVASSRFEEALTYYNNVKQQHPYSPLAVDAELEIANVYFAQKEFIAAEGSYRNFYDLHPEHKESDFVIYQIANSINKQVPKVISRDITAANRAILYYNRLIKYYPDSKHVEDAKKQTLSNQNKLAAKQKYIADYYLKHGQYLSAIGRYDRYSKVATSDKQIREALLGSVTAATALEDSDIAELYLGKLKENYPNSEETRRATKVAKGLL